MAASTLITTEASRPYAITTLLAWALGYMITTAQHYHWIAQYQLCKTYCNADTFLE